MGVYRAYLDNRLHKVVLLSLSPFVALGFIMDVFANVFVASIIFLELPKEWLVTTRLTKYKEQDKYKYNWRKELADLVCRNLLDVFDPTGKHCDSSTSIIK